MIKVLLVDDSPVVHEVLKKFFEKKTEIEIVGNVYNGEEALHFLKTMTPDVVIMDIEMPVMDGLTAIKKIMEEKPLPIIVFSAATKKIADLVMKSLEAGAVDVVEKPENMTTAGIEEYLEKNLFQKIKIFYGFKVVKRISDLKIKELAEKKERLELLAKNKSLRSKKELFPVVGIASSTGGPQTLKKIFSQIKKPTYPIVVIQHIPHNFVESLREWLMLHTQAKCEFVQEGGLPEPGKIYLVNVDRHLTFSPEGRFKFFDAPPIYGIRPSADYMFEFLGKVYKERAIGIVLTGMGEDGKKGAKFIKENQGTIITEAEEDCIIYGMPRAVIESGLADKIMRINEIVDFLNQLTEFF
ncbi:chemotaxis-specific protein-glutamate methyltransferase CheB [Thermospira aquatica]|uniref:Protein-glutamate methylesterase/protein-glutamine glutaminase n=1 Tax=Thermospira aquatica TaxID=2828656 RepID=A0AAX3BD74_9SPIR|nr:chemotaxis-specific protein-glutamate methyltransferase CheB [Thermospira aquatica]URA10151.1 chemotaxis-specific protein-glutamate methyltransferase CheB [Thermospira aquatica]